jgi:hypothetical protein
VFICVHLWLKQKPHRRLAVGFDKSCDAIRTQPPRGTTAARLAADSDSNYGSPGQNSTNTWPVNCFSGWYRENKEVAACRKPCLTPGVKVMGKVRAQSAAADGTAAAGFAENFDLEDSAHLTPANSGN